MGIYTPTKLGWWPSPNTRTKWEFRPQHIWPQLPRNIFFLLLDFLLIALLSMAVHGEGLQKTHRMMEQESPTECHFLCRQRYAYAYKSLHMCVYIYTDCQAIAKPRAKYKLFVHLVGRRWSFYDFNQRLEKTHLGRNISKKNSEVHIVIFNIVCWMYTYNTHCVVCECIWGAVKICGHPKECSHN